MNLVKRDQVLSADPLDRFRIAILRAGVRVTSIYDLIEG
jgi:hypothetical protein